MSDDENHRGGWLNSFRRIGDSFWGLLRTRMELFAVEWQEEKLRLVSLLIWLAVAVLLGAAGLLVILAALAFWLWTVAGYAGLILLAVAMVGASAILLLRIRRRIKTGPPPFAETRAEFKKDSECLRNKA